MRCLITGILTITLGASMAYAGLLGDFDPEEDQPELSYRLNEPGLELLDRFGFAFYPSRYEEIYDVYEDYREYSQTPMFITTDLSFHTLHLMVDYSVRVLELEELLPRLETLTEGMVEHALEDVRRLSGEAKKVAEAELVYFAVAAKLLELDIHLPDRIERQVDAEFAKIEAHSGIEEVEFLPQTSEDYSQYVPRGHYTRSDDFKRYFKAMMWFGRLPLAVPVEPGKPLLAFKVAVLVAVNLEGDDELAGLWEEIYEPTAFFFGAAEDLTPGLLYWEAEEFLGEELNVGILDDEVKLRELADYLCVNIKPRILSQEVLSSGEEVRIPLSLRFMPQRFIPDSYMFSQLVLGGGVSSYRAQTEIIPFTWGMTDLGPMRVFPRGLDAMAVIGWGVAEDILRKDRDMDYVGYAGQYDKLVDWYESLDEQERESSIYYRWFELFRAYKDARAPGLVHANAWERKKLLTALGSWTELRHDAILYAKQSYTARGTAVPPPPPPPMNKAVIETSPEVYAAMAQCARVIADFFGEGDENSVRAQYARFAELLDGMDSLSRKQMAGVALTDDEHRWLWNLPRQLVGLEWRLKLKTVTTDADDFMALIADVHTDLNSGQVLEEATGYPAKIYVLVELDGAYRIAQGAAFTYYEFKHQMSDRLTDEAWQEMLERGENPEFPTWITAMFAR